VRPLYVNENGMKAGLCNSHNASVNPAMALEVAFADESSTGIFGHIRKGDCP